MSQGAFAALMLSIALVLIVLVELVIPRADDGAERCKAAGGELVAVRAGKPVCIRRDALIEP